MRFEVYKHVKRFRACDLDGVTKPKVFPCFELVYNDGWNDFDIYSWFALWYFPSRGVNPTFLGELKIIKKGEEKTFDCIPKEFEEKLPPDFCSLGINIQYYQRLKQHLSPKVMGRLLNMLNDAAISKRIQEDFANNKEFNTSLLRDYAANQALTHGRFILDNRSKEQVYSFSYKLFNYELDKPFGNWDVKLPFKPNAYSRLLGIIGNNGVGKTFLLRHFVDDFLTRDISKFNGSIPLFDSLCVISSTKHDKYKVHEDVSEIYNLVYLDNYKFEQLRDIIKSINGRKTLNNESLLTVYRNLLINCIGHQIEPIFEFVENPDDGEGQWKVKYDSLVDIFPNLSSGQRQILLMVSNLFAHIHLSSLIIIDEPEVHLHPHALTEFMLTLSEVINLFDSFAIVVTHSPLIVREIISRNVYHLIRLDDNTPSISTVGFDTFGEDIALLYSRIFGYDENGSIFTRIVNERCEDKRSASDVIEQLESEIGELNLNARMRIAEIFSRKNRNA